MIFHRLGLFATTMCAVWSASQMTQLLAEEPSHESLVSVSTNVTFNLPPLKDVPKPFQPALEKIRDAGRIHVVEQPPLALDFVPQHVSLSADGSKIVIAKGEPQAEVWDLTERRRLSTYKSETEQSAQLWTAVTPDGEYGLLTHPSGRVDVFDAKTGKRVYSHEKPDETVGPIAVSPDGKLAFMADNRPAFMIYPLLGGKGSELSGSSGIPGLRTLVPGPSDNVHFGTISFGNQMFANLMAELPGMEPRLFSLDFQRVPELRQVRKTFGFTAGTAADEVSYLVGQGETTQIELGIEKGQLKLNWSGQSSRIADAGGVGLIDGECLVIANLDGLVEFATPEGGAGLIHSLLPIDQSARQVAVSRNGRIIARLEESQPKQVRLWRVESHPLSGFDQLGKEVAAALEAKDYAALDQLYEAFLQSKATIPVGNLHSFTSVLVKLVTKGDPSEHVAAWKKANPDSILCRVLEAGQLTRSAWEIRGSGFAAEVGPEKLEGFRQEMEKATEVLKSIPLEKAPVQTFRDLALVAQALSWEEKEINKLVEELLKSPYARDFDFHLVVAVNRLARWHGFDGHSRAYALEMKERIGGADGLEVFLSIAGHLSFYFSHDEFFDRTKFTQEELLEAAEALEKLTSESNPLSVTTRLRLTWTSADGENAGEQFERFRRAGSPYLPNFWRTVTPYEQAYVWCREAGKIVANEKKSPRQANAPVTGPPKDKSRFVDRGEYVEDTETGRLWQKDGDASTDLNYYQAVRYAERLRIGGLRHWRLPTPEELLAIYPATEAPFVDTRKSGKYWTSKLFTDHRDYAAPAIWSREGKHNSMFASKNFVLVRCVHDPVN